MSPLAWSLTLLAAWSAVAVLVRALIHASRSRSSEAMPTNREKAS